MLTANAVTLETDTGRSNVASQEGGAKTLKIEVSTGDISVNFQE